MNIFYCPDALLNEHLSLDETESRHLVSVLRKEVGDEIVVFDGKGNLFHAQIESVDKKKNCVVHISNLISTEPQTHAQLHIAIAPPKNIERFEWFIEKATEIGVHQISPVICKHSERKELRIDRLQKIIVSACKQSLKYSIPVLHQAVSFNSFIGTAYSSYQKYIAHSNEAAPHLLQACLPQTNTMVLIGPEGDFTKEELAAANNSGYQTVSLGKSRLRLETAGVYAATVFNLVNES